MLPQLASSANCIHASTQRCAPSEVYDRALTDEELEIVEKLDVSSKQRASTSNARGKRRSLVKRGNRRPWKSKARDRRVIAEIGGLRGVTFDDPSGRPSTSPVRINPTNDNRKFPRWADTTEQIKTSVFNEVLGVSSNKTMRTINLNLSESVRKHHAGLHSFRSIRRIEARRRKASALRLRHSQSFANLRQRASQARVRSTIQRLGRARKPLALSDRLTISTLTRARMRSIALWNSGP